jgi:adenylate cyclase
VAGERVERRLAAVLAADVAGYSRLMGADEVGTLAALKAIRRDIVDPAIAEHKGRIVKTTGDGMLVEFASAFDAVTCATAVQGKMAESGDVAHGILFRIGINVGDIIVDGDDIFGDGVNVAARVENECEPGGVCLSGSAYEQVRGKSAFAFADLGERSLKNIDRPVRLYAAQTAATTVASAKAHAEATKPLTVTDKPSIAVLPFENMSADPEQEYFADGIVEEIITALSRFKSLFVIARNSSFTYKGKAIDIKQVGRELGVRYVLEGSVRKGGGKVRITGQLIEVATGMHLWADHFDGTLDDIFELQDKVTSSVVGAIAPSVTRAEMERAKRKPPNDLNAYDCFLKGQWAMWRNTKDGTDEAINLYEQAVALDRQFAPAYAGVASGLNQRINQQWSADPASDMSRAMECARHALSLNPEEHTTLVRIAWVFSLVGGELERADSLFAEAVRLNPNGMEIWTFGGFNKLFLGDHQSALEHFHRAIRISPTDPRLYFAQCGVASALFFLGDYEGGRKYAVEALRDHPNYVSGLRMAMACSAFAGDMKAAHEFYRQFAAFVPMERVSNQRKRVTYRREEDYRRLEESLRLAGMPE